MRMARRSDHSRAELREMIVAEGQRQMTEAGFARFSAREVAKRIGYTIGTLYNVFGSHDGLVLAINARTLELWALDLRRHLDGCGGDRIACLVYGYFAFAQAHRNAWAAIYDHRLPQEAALPGWYADEVAALTGIVVDEVAAVLLPSARAEAPALTRSLLAIVHGHCDLEMTGTLAILGELSPPEAALARVREVLAAHRNEGEAS